MIFSAKDGRTTELEIREAKGADFDGIRECLQAVYKGEYLLPAALEPGYLEHRSQTEDYHLYVAAAADGTVAAQIGYYTHPWFPDCREQTILAVRPEYRSFGLGGFLIEMMARISDEIGSGMTFGRVLTHTPFSQRCFDKLGYTPCGFWFSEHDNKIQAPSFNNATCKLSTAIYAKPAAILERCVHVPPLLAPMAERIFKSLGLPAQVICETQDAVPETSSLTLRVNDIHCTCFLTVDSCGADLHTAADKLLKPCEDGRHTFVLFLNMGSPTALYGYSALRRLGFCFAGFFPASPGNEYILMCRWGAEPFRPHEMKLTAPAQALLDEILILQGGDTIE